MSDSRMAPHRKHRPPSPGRIAKKNETSWKLDLREAEVAQSSWHWGAQRGNSRQHYEERFHPPPEPRRVADRGQSGTLAQTGWPILTIESAKLRYTGASLFVTESALRAGEGRIEVDGEINFDHAADFQARLDHIIDHAAACRPIGACVCTANSPAQPKSTPRFRAATPQIEGDLRLADGQLEALPLLDQIATFTRTERFRRIDVDPRLALFHATLPASRR